MTTQKLPGTDAARHGTGDADLTIMLAAHDAFRRDLTRLARTRPLEAPLRAHPALVRPRCGPSRAPALPRDRPDRYLVADEPLVQLDVPDVVRGRAAARNAGYPALRVAECLPCYFSPATR